MMSPMKPPKQTKQKKAAEFISPDKIEQEGGDKYEIFERLMLESKSEEEIGIGE